MNEIDALKKNTSHLMKRLNHAKEEATHQMKINTLRKQQLERVSKWCDKLLAEGRITKEELNKVFPKKRLLG